MQTRRQLIRSGAAAAGLATAVAWLPQQALAFEEAPFKAVGVEETLKSLGVSGAAEESADVNLKGPDIAENGAVVPFTVSTSLAGATKLALLVEHNPNTLVALFNIDDNVEPEFATRSKMQETSNVYAVAITDDGKAYFDMKEVKVTIGGCGG